MNINRHNQQKNSAAIAHRESLRRSLEHRLEVARSKGDENLIQKLEKEASYLHLK
jgi:hypothetical protein